MCAQRQHAGEGGFARLLLRTFTYESACVAVVWPFPKRKRKKKGPAGPTPEGTFRKQLSPQRFPDVIVRWRLEARPAVTRLQWRQTGLVEQLELSHFERGAVLVRHVVTVEREHQRTVAAF